jgi:hypothetical protein
MPKSFQDEFDAATGVGGKHLAPKRPLDYIVSFLTLTFLSAALAGGGILGLQLWDTGVILSGLVAQEDRVPQLEVAIVDGTNSGKAQAIGDELLEEGWNIVSATSLSDLDPALEPAVSTLIFLSNEAYRADAAGLLSIFPDAAITVSDQFLAPVTVLIGTDFVG